MVMSWKREGGREGGVGLHEMKCYGQTDRQTGRQRGRDGGREGGRLGTYIGDQHQLPPLHVFRREERDLPRHHAHVVQARWTANLQQLQPSLLLFLGGPLLRRPLLHQPQGSALARHDQLDHRDDLRRREGGKEGGREGGREGEEFEMYRIIKKVVVERERKENAI